MKKYSKKCLIIFIWLIIWQLAAALTDNTIAFVGPAEMIYALFKDCISKDFLLICAYSFVRITGGFIIAFILGLLLGILSYRFKLFKEFISPVMTVFKTVPVASFIILALMLFGSSGVALIISAIIVIPIIYMNSLAGLESTDKLLLEMSHVFKFGIKETAWYIYRPFLMPHLESAGKSALGMCWKAGIAAEVIGTPANSIGSQMYLSKVYLATDELFAWTLVVIVLSILFEKVFISILRRFSV